MRCHFKKIKFAVIAATVWLTLPSQAAAQDRFDGWCDDLRNTSSADLVKFLHHVVRNQKNGRCITWAIHKLGNERYEPAIPMMANLLDFRRPLMDDEKIGFHLRIQGIPERFPAACGWRYTNTTDPEELRF